MAQGDNHPILKPGKDDNICKNWRTISILCPAAKMLEKLLLTKILTHIPFHPAQHGFWPKHSTCTALSTITANIAAGFSRKKPAHQTVLVALDLTAVFDNVTISNCSIVSSTPTCPQQSVAGSTTICRTDEPKFIFSKKNLKAER